MKEFELKKKETANRGLLLNFSFCKNLEEESYSKPDCSRSYKTVNLVSVG